MKENNKMAITVIVVVIAAVLFISCSVVFNKKNGGRHLTCLPPFILYSGGNRR